MRHCSLGVYVRVKLDYFRSSFFHDDRNSLSVESKIRWRDRRSCTSSPAALHQIPRQPTAARRALVAAGLAI